MPNVVRRILTMKLVGDLTGITAESYLARLRTKNLRFADFEEIVRAVAALERQAELVRTMKNYTKPPTTGRMSSYSP